MEESNNEEATENPVHSSSSSNIASSEIDAETASKLRGDAIGDTMYSEVFVLNTLLQFNDLKWNSEVEDNLCFLWDMTEEKDVCQYLFKISYPTLACSAIEKYNEPRFIEIVVGIYANILCSKCEKNINESEIKIVIDLLDSNDPYILIQVMRFLQAISFIFDKLHFITDDHMGRFNFILYSSTNQELLMHALKTLASITSDTKLNENVIKAQLLSSTITAYRLVKEDVDSESEFERQDERLITIKYLIQLACNICTYIDNFKLTRLENELDLDEFIKEISNLFNHYTIESNLVPIPEEFTFYVEALSYICKILSLGYTSPLVVPLCKIMLILSEKGINSETVTELLCYFISVGTIDDLRKDFIQFPQMKACLSDIEKRSFNFDFDYLTNLHQILNVL